MLPKTESSKTSLDSEEQIILSAYRTVREKVHGDLQISVVGGKLVKVWEVVKHDYRDMALREADL